MATFCISSCFSIEKDGEKFIGEIAAWDASEAALAKACEKTGREYKVNPGDGAFYGPKLDFHIRDSLGRNWQCSTVQLDMNLPERFDLEYIASDGSKQRPTMIHHVILGSIERFIGIITEHYAGNFPLWLAPTQMVIIPVHPQNNLAYAEELKDKLDGLGYRVYVDDRNEKLGYRLREAQIKKIPLQLTVGEAEETNQTVNLRRHGEKDSSDMSITELLDYLERKVTEKSR